MNEINALFAANVALQNSAANRAEWPITRCFTAVWASVIAVAGIDATWLSLSHYSFAVGPLWTELQGPLALCVLALLMRRAFSMDRSGSLARIARGRELCAICEGLGLVFIFGYATLILQSLCVAVAAPLVDDRLIAMDAMLGFSWVSSNEWYRHHQDLFNLLGWVYRTYTWQLVITIFFLAFTERIEVLYDFLILLAATAILTILMSAAVPATNPFIHFGVVGRYQDSPWSQFLVLRESANAVIDLTTKQGLISMPSLHTAHALLFVYAVRRIKYLFPFSILLNVTMIYSAIVCGAHYLVDIIAGIILALASIVALAYLRHSDVSTSA